MNARKLALDAINNITLKNAYTNIVVNETLSKFELSNEDKSFFTALVYGTIQNLITLDYYISPFINTKKTKPWIKNILYLSVYQLVYMELKEYAVLDEAVELAKSKDNRIGGFVNGVLRNFIRSGKTRGFENLDELERLSIKYSIPLWLVSYIMKDYPLEVTEKILIDSMKVKNDGVKINTLKTTKEEVIARLTKDGIEVEDAPFVKNGIIVKSPVINHPLFKEGYITMQDISSQKVAEVINPNEDDVIIDLCSAPGGKSINLSYLMNNKGTIYSCDIHNHKIKLLKENFRKLGITNCKPQLISALEVANKVKEKSFDHVLADCPCSGLGVFNHKVDLKYHITYKAIEEVIKLQKDILEATWNLVKVGGYYTYSTCTINKEENELQIKAFLERHSEFELVYEEAILPFEYESDGFYIAKLKRVK